MTPSIGRGRRIKPPLSNALLSWRSVKPALLEGYLVPNPLSFSSQTEMVLSVVCFSKYQSRLTTKSDD
jgi:hypothetical protein